MSDFVTWRESDNRWEAHGDVHDAQLEAVNKALEAVSKTSNREDVRMAQSISLMSLGIAIASVVITLTK